LKLFGRVLRTFSGSLIKGKKALTRYEVSAFYQF
jgi:hypothetical protein